MTPVEDDPLPDPSGTKDRATPSTAKAKHRAVTRRGRKITGRGRRAAVVSASVSAVVLIVVIALVIAFVNRDEPGARSVDDAVDDFRSAATVHDDGRVFSRPAQGVYELSGQGSESLSLPPAEQRDSDIMPASVTHLADGCWRWRVDYNAAHSHAYDFCPDGADLLLVRQSNLQSWNFGSFTIDNNAEYTCEPPSPVVVATATPGTELNHTCSGTNSAVPGESINHGSAEIIGTEQLDIGDTEVTTIRLESRTSFSGPQSGTVQETWWYEIGTGLPVRSTRNFEIRTSIALGTIDYREQGSWQITSLTPRT